MDLFEDVVKIKKTIENFTSHDSTDVPAAIDVLTKLKQMPITLEMLQKSHIGVTVNNFRKSATNEEVVNLSKSLIKHWKRLLHDDMESHAADGGNQNQYRSARRSRSSSTGSSRRDSVTSTTSSNDPDDSTGQDLPSPVSGAGGDGLATISEVVSHHARCAVTVNIPKASFTSDPVRQKSREMLSAALKLPPIPEGAVNIDDYAAAVEDCVFDEFKSTEIKYKNRIRSRVANLRDVKNPHLREKVLYGEIEPAHLARMTADELASSEMKQVRERLAKEAFNDHQMTFTPGTVTDQFQCSSCKKQNTSYTELQATSPDEPLITYILCNECGNRWKMT